MPLFFVYLSEEGRRGAIFIVIFVCICMYLYVFSRISKNAVGMGVSGQFVCIF